MTNSINLSRAFIALVLGATSLLATANETATPMSSLSCKAPEYDAKLVQAEEKGVVKLRFTTDADGKVLDAIVKESSGYVKLDRASVNALKSCRLTVASNASFVGAANDISKLDEKLAPETQGSRLVKFNWVIN